MAVSGKYGKLEIPRIAAEEPVFILRAQDILAGSAIKLYQVLVDSHGIPLDGKLDREIERFANWPGQRKLPD